MRAGREVHLPIRLRIRLPIRLRMTRRNLTQNRTYRGVGKTGVTRLNSETSSDRGSSVGDSSYSRYASADNFNTKTCSRNRQYLLTFSSSDEQPPQHQSFCVIADFETCIGENIVHLIILKHRKLVALHKVCYALRCAD